MRVASPFAHGARAAVAALLGTVTAVCVTPARARASDGFGARGRTVVVLDHLVGVTDTSVRPESGRSLGLLEIGTPNGLGLLPSGLARLGVHQFFGDVVSLGAGVHWSTFELGSNELTVLSLSPRLGFAVPFSATSALWLRAGYTYLRASDDDDAVQSEGLIGTELQYVSTPAPHFGWTLGPMAEIGVTGEARINGGAAAKLKRRVFGATFGILLSSSPPAPAGGPSQIRTCGFPASGSSGVGFATCRSGGRCAPRAAGAARGARASHPTG